MAAGILALTPDTNHMIRVAILIFDLSIFSIFKKIDLDQIDLVDLPKDLLAPPLRSMASISSRRSLKRSTVIESIFRSQQMIDSIEKQMIEFPTLYPSL